MQGTQGRQMMMLLGVVAAVLIRAGPEALAVQAQPVPAVCPVTAPNDPERGSRGAGNYRNEALAPVVWPDRRVEFKPQVVSSRMATWG
jgi:hypothetical protein